jgi:hypothetical protein
MVIFFVPAAALCLAQSQAARPRNFCNGVDHFFFFFLTAYWSC